MKSYLLLIFSCCLTQISLQITLYDAKSYYKCKEKESIRLKCPIVHESNDDEHLILITWFKNSNRLQVEEDNRLKQEDTYLRIKNVQQDDTGLYECQATNGYGHAKFNMTLDVISSGLNIKKIQQQQQQQKQTYVLNRNDLLKPMFIEESLFEIDSIIRKTKGSEIKLSCALRKSVLMSDVDILWFKDGKILSEEDYGITRSKSIIDLKDLRLYDSGNFTCKVSNKYGTIQKKFELYVYDDSLISEGIDPLNITIDKQQDAQFNCRIRSETKPKIEWLKQITGDEYRNYVLESEPIEKFDENSFLNSFFSSSHTSHVSESIEFDGTHYITITSSNEDTYFDDALSVWVNELVIRNTSDKDSGVYLCFGATSNGFSYKKAELFVISHDESLMIHTKILALFNSPSLLFICIPISMLLLVVFVCIFYLRRFITKNQAKSSCLDKLVLVLTKRCCSQSFLKSFDSVSDTSTTRTTSTTYYSPVENAKIPVTRQSNEYKSVHLDSHPPATPSKASLIYYKVLEFDNDDKFIDDAKSAVSSSSRFYYQVNASDMDSMN